MIVSPLYVIVDAETLRRHGMTVEAMARELGSAGVELVQYRDKDGGPQEVLAAAAALKAALPGALLVMNDRADLAALAGVCRGACGAGGSGTGGCEAGAWG